MDNLGFGCTQKYDKQWIEHQDSFNDLLAGLNQATGKYIPSLCDTIHNEKNLKYGIQETKLNPLFVWQIPLKSAVWKRLDLNLVTDTKRLPEQRIFQMLLQKIWR